MSQISAYKAFIQKIQELNLNNCNKGTIFEKISIANGLNATLCLYKMLQMVQY